MRYIKLFENFDENKIKSDLQDIFVELIDNGFVVNVSTHLVKLDDNIDFEGKDDIKKKISLINRTVKIPILSASLPLRSPHRLQQSSTVFFRF